MQQIEIEDMTCFWTVLSSFFSVLCFLLMLFPLGDVLSLSSARSQMMMNHQDKLMKTAGVFFLFAILFFSTWWFLSSTVKEEMVVFEVVHTIKPKTKMLVGEGLTLTTTKGLSAKATDGKILLHVRWWRDGSVHAYNPW